MSDPIDIPKSRENLKTHMIIQTDKIPIDIQILCPLITDYDLYKLSKYGFVKLEVGSHAYYYSKILNQHGVVTWLS